MKLKKLSYLALFTALIFGTPNILSADHERTGLPPGNNSINLQQEDDEAQTNPNLLVRLIPRRSEPDGTNYERMYGLGPRYRHPNTEPSVCVATNHCDLGIIRTWLNNAGTNVATMINQIDSNGDTALHIAIEHKSERIAELLLRYGANPDIKNDTGENALHLAVQRGNLNIVNAILNVFDIRRDIPRDFINATNEHGQTPLDIAIEYRNIAPSRNPITDQIIANLEARGAIRNRIVPIERRVIHARPASPRWFNPNF